MIIPIDGKAETVLKEKEIKKIQKHAVGGIE